VKTISMRDFRENSARIIAEVQKGQRMILTYRGKPVARLEPIVQTTSDRDDPFYSLTGISGVGESQSNGQIDDLLYGQ
jgi:prevent-host-death family protein